MVVVVSTYAVQVVLSGMGMALGVGMLALGRDPAVFLPLVSSIIAYWLPAPRPAPLWRRCDDTAWYLPADDASNTPEAASSVKSVDEAAKKKPSSNDNDDVVGEN